MAYKCQEAYPTTQKRVVNNYTWSLEADGGYHDKQYYFETVCGIYSRVTKAHNDHRWF